MREIVRKASPETESLWIELAKAHSYQEIELLIRRTPHGALPGDLKSEDEYCTSELRCSLSDEVFAMLTQARRAYSIEKGEAVTTAEVLEWALVSYLASHPSEAAAMEKVREAADKDVQAERSRELPIVDKAREIAADMGLLGGAKTCGFEVSSNTDEGHPLTQALGANPFSNVDMVEDGKGSEASPSFQDYELEENDPQRVIATDSPGAQSWQHSRLRYNPQARHTTPAQTQEILRRDGWCCKTPGCPNEV